MRTWLGKARSTSSSVKRMYGICPLAVVSPAPCQKSGILSGRKGETTAATRGICLGKPAHRVTQHGASTCRLTWPQSPREPALGVARLDARHLLVVGLVVHVQAAADNLKVYLVPCKANGWQTLHRPRTQSQSRRAVHVVSSRQRMYTALTAGGRFYIP